ncbi:MAG: LysR family transcriptional regulator [Pseudomonadota bacterium]
MIDPLKIQQLDLNLLKVFESLYQERNMTQVAKTLFISPSAVSHAIKRLRQALDDDLFVRQGAQMRPTPLCDSIAPRIIASLERLRQVLQSCGEFTFSETQQTFTIAQPEPIEPIVLPRLQQELLQQAPKAKLASVRVPRDAMVRKLTAQQIDVAIDIALPIKLPVKHLVLSRDDYCVLMDKRHAYVQKLTAKSYLNSQHIVVSSRAKGRVLEDYALLEQGENRHIAIRCQSYQTAKSMLKNSPYLLTLPSAIAQQIQDKELMMLAMPIELPQIITHLYWHQNSSSDPALIWLRETIKKAFTLD